MYDAMTWRYCWSRTKLNFPKFELAEEVKFIAPAIRIIFREEEKAHHRAVARQRVKERGELYMQKFVKDNPNLVVAELEFFTKRDKERKKKGRGDGTQKFHRGR